MKFICKILRFLKRMAQKLINIGSAYKDPDSDKSRDAFDKINDNFTELYNNTEINKQYVNIGTWDMNTDDEKYVSFALPNGAFIREFSAFVYKDDLATVYPLSVGNATGEAQGSITYNQTNERFECERIAAGIFDAATFETLPNRGYIVVHWEYGS